MRSFSQRAGAFAVLLALAIASLPAGCAPRPRTGLDDAIGTLSRGGVAVFEGYGAGSPIAAVSGPYSAMRLTRWQLANLVTQAGAGMGFTGAELDRIGAARAPRGAPSFSYFLAAWLKRSDGALARYAATFVTHPDDKHAPRMRFPLLVVTLFIADAARTTEAPPSRQTGFEWERMIAAPAAAAGVCSTVVNFTDSVVANVINALRSNGDSFFAKLWNTVIEIVVAGAQFVVAAALAPVFHVIGLVAGVIAVITLVSSSIQAWTLTVAENPVALKLGGQPQAGSFQATLEAPSLPWPDDIVDCAHQFANIDIQAVNYVGAPVTWSPSGALPGKAIEKSKDATIDAAKHASFAIETVPVEDEPPPECSVENFVGSIGMTATVERSDVGKLQQLLMNAVTAQLPSAIRSVVLPLLQPWIDQGMHNLQSFLAHPVQSNPALIQLSQLQPDPDKCKPASKQTAPPPGPPTGVPTNGPSADNARLKGRWNCSSSAVAHTAMGGIRVDVEVDLIFDGIGMARSQTSTSLVPYEQDEHHLYSVKNGKKDSFSGSLPYKYVPSDEAHGVLFASGSAGSPYHVSWNDAKHWSSPMANPAGGPALMLRCTQA